MQFRLEFVSSSIWRRGVVDGVLQGYGVVWSEVSLGLGEYPEWRLMLCRGRNIEVLSGNVSVYFGMSSPCYCILGRWELVHCCIIL
jgi:hypothetical protein